jgi:guanylate kinase
VEGAMNVLNYYKEKGDNKIVSVFMAPPSLESLKQRLVGRGTETIEQIEKRLSRASEELSLADKYDKVIVLNNIDEGVNEFRNFIKEEIKKHD